MFIKQEEIVISDKKQNHFSFPEPQPQSSRREESCPGVCPWLVLAMLYIQATGPRSLGMERKKSLSWHQECNSSLQEDICRVKKLPWQNKQFIIMNLDYKESKADFKFPLSDRVCLHQRRSLTSHQRNIPYTQHKEPMNLEDTIYSLFQKNSPC